MNYKIFAGIGVIILCITMGITFHIQNKKLVESGNEDKLKGPFPWWYYIGVLISAILILGPFNKTINYLGNIILFFMVCFGMKYKMK